MCSVLENLRPPLAGSVPGVADPIRVSATPVTYRSEPPLLGQDTAAVLADWLGAAGPAS
jgi:crotonobetainyl-CoA:carnitine CoA-transferase CaiB-like acyl-CoA transferase